MIQLLSTAAFNLFSQKPTPYFLRVKLGNRFVSARQPFGDLVHFCAMVLVLLPQALVLS